MNPREFLQTKTLDEMQTEYVHHLVQACQQQDHASPCVQMEHTLNADQEMDSWFLCHESNQLVGLASIFAPSLEEAEISICVDHSHRSQGIGESLLIRASDYLRKMGCSVLLLVCDRNSHAGSRFAAQHSTGIQHTEYDMRLCMPFSGSIEKNLVLKQAILADLPAMITICHSAHGADDRDFDGFLRNSLSLPDRIGYIGYMDGTPVAVCFVGIHSDSASLNTVAVRKELQGQGLGRAFLSAVILCLAQDHPRIDISVDSTNAPAYALYRRLGFVDRCVVDYHVLNH